MQTYQTASNVVPLDVPRAASLPLNKETDLIRRFLQDIEQAGLVGEQDNAVLVLLCAVSARLSRPLNLTVQGPSSGGKNHLLGTVASFIPENCKKFISGMTPKALMHCAEDEYEHKAIFIAEYEGVAKADYAIRTMQSEQVISWDFVESSSSRGIRQKNRVVKGPAAFIQATTRPVLHPENETRMLFTQIDESAKLTRAIMSRQAQEAAQGKNVVVDLYQPWHELIDRLEINSARIPFAEHLANYLPDDRVRSRRDFPKLLGLIEALAVFHQNCREKDGQFVIASPVDYEIAKRLFEFCFSVGPDKALGELLRAAEALQSAKGHFNVGDLMEKTGLGKSWTYEVLKRAEDLGCIAEIEPRGSYRFVRQFPISPLELPETLEVQ